MDKLRLSSRAKDQLLRLRRLTGIRQWNVLCRWALCTSLADTRMMSTTRIVGDSNVEMTWKVLTGTWGDVYEALLRQRALADSSATDTKSLNLLLQRHIHRGIGMLSSDPTIRDIHSLYSRLMNDSPSNPESPIAG